MKLDQHQIKIWDKLNQLTQDFQKQSQKNIISKFFAKNLPKIASIYIYGDVGRGKTMLMKSFYESVINQAKIYIHFNSFMRKIHEALRDIRKEDKKYKDELIEAVQRVIKDKNQNIVKLICFDEFQVNDIADAMLLSRIFSYLFVQNIVVVFTSNLQPLDLYKNGLQRELFLQFVNNILLKNCQVLNLNGPTDYREKIALSEKNNNIEGENIALDLKITKRYFISNQKNLVLIDKIIKTLINNQLKPRIIKVWGREVIIKKTYDQIAVINFNELCRNNYSASDYQNICQKFDLIFLLELPQINEENVSEAKRLMLFIDEIYENKTSLIISSSVKIDKIYSKVIGSRDFKRSVSRLKEIKSEIYWKSSKFTKTFTAN